MTSEIAIAEVSVEKTTTFRKKKDKVLIICLLAIAHVYVLL